MAAESGHGGMLSRICPAGPQVLASLGAVAGVVVGGRYLTRPIFRFIAAARLREIFTASALLLVVAVAALMEMVGLSPALGAFLAGVVLAESEFRRELETDIEPFRGLLLGLFFITVGAGLNFGLIAGPAGADRLAGSGPDGAQGRWSCGAWGWCSGATASDAATIAVALAQGGEFAFVLLGFVQGAGVMGGEEVGNRHGGGGAVDGADPAGLRALRAPGAEPRHPAHRAGAPSLRRPATRTSSSPASAASARSPPAC